MKRGLSWNMCLMSLLVLPMGVSAIAFQVIKTPHSFSCETIDEQADASQRLYCAKARAQQKTPDDLAVAIRLVGNLPSDLQSEGKQLVLQWSSELMSQAEVAFQAGEFENAIDLANSIPRTSPSYDETQRRIADWKGASQKADEIAEKAIAQMAQREWQQSLKTAGQLKSIPHAAWVNDRYIALVQQIKADREFRDSKLAIEPPRKVALLNQGMNRFLKASQGLAEIYKIIPPISNARKVTPPTFKSNFAKVSAQKPTAEVPASTIVEPVGSQHFELDFLAPFYPISTPEEGFVKG